MMEVLGWLWSGTCLFLYVWAARTVYRSYADKPNGAPESSSNVWYGFDLNDIEHVTRIHVVREAFGNALQKDVGGRLVRSTNELAHSPDEIRRALLAMLAVAEGRTSSLLIGELQDEPGAAESIRKCLVFLDDFVPSTPQSSSLPN